MPVNQVTNYGNVTREETLVFLNSRQLAGVQNIQIGYENNAQETKYLGMGKCNKLPVGPQIGSFNLSYFIISDELVLPCTGNTGINAYVLKSKLTPTNNYSLSSGYLVNYGSRGGIGEIPQANASFAVFGNIGALSVIETSRIETELTAIGSSNSTLVLKPTAPNYITLNLDDFTTNRVISYDLSITVNRNPIYTLGNRYPTAIKYIPPIGVDINFLVEKNNYTAQKLGYYPFLEKVRNLSISLRDTNNNNTVVRYDFDNMMLRSEILTMNVDGRQVYQLGYRNYFV